MRITLAIMEKFQKLFKGCDVEIIFFEESLHVTLSVIYLDLFDKVETFTRCYTYEEIYKLKYPTDIFNIFRLDFEDSFK